MNDPREENTVVRSISFTAKRTGDRTRITCNRCDALLFEHHGELDQQSGLTLIEQLREHGCFAPMPANLYVRRQRKPA